MRKKTIIIFGFVVLFVTGLYFLLPPIENFYWRYKSFQDREYYKKLEEIYSHKPKEFLLRKVKGKINFKSYVAANVLMKKTDIEIFPEMVEIIKNSKNIPLQLSAIYILTKRGEEKVLPILMDIVEHSPSNDLYIEALQGVARMKYEPALPYVISLSERKPTDKLFDDRVYAISMLENYTQQDAISALEKIAKNDPDDFIRYTAKQAVKKIKKNGQ